MRRPFVHVLLVLALAATASPAAADPARSWAESIELAGATRLDLDLPVGELEIVGTRGDTLRLELTVECSRLVRRCEGDAEDLRLDVDRRGDRLRVKVEGWPKFSTGGLSVDVRASVPSHLATRIDLGVGEVRIEGLRSDLDLDVGVGDVEIDVDADDVRSVEVDSGIGKGSIRVDGERVDGGRSFLGGESRWTGGGGEARVSVDVGIGAVQIDVD